MLSKIAMCLINKRKILTKLVINRKLQFLHIINKKLTFNLDTLLSSVILFTELTSF